MINVTKTHLPPMREYMAILRRAWDAGWITNHGALVTELEAKIKAYLGVEHFWFVANGTVALQLALRALEVQGEVITTPFSYVASTSSIVWERCTPVFVDVDPVTLCLDPTRIEAAITPETRAILGVHIYGNGCDVEAIEAIAQRHGLRVIYDAAHAFGVRDGARSLLSYGDVATLSFHATKVFHTVEGGGLVTNDPAVAHRLSYLRNFGHNGEEAFWGLGINGKNSEVHAAMGLAMLPRLPRLIERRGRVVAAYDRALRGSRLRRPAFRDGLTRNHGYYPVLFESEDQLLRVREHMVAHDIRPRRYFYPSLTTLEYVPRQSCPIAEDAARRVLCLPLYAELSVAEARRIAACLREKL